ncbi:hypothetical protein [Clostridium sp. C2-6-12]|uniref:hypothetical protein n=1 Tax=Clostridium sp. C2-6-12 TaxID=2698832 RepID=UPI001370F3EA|nr:hypothetical protein [Clostridium sp. C2-6-12]
MKKVNLNHIKSWFRKTAENFRLPYGNIILKMEIKKCSLYYCTNVKDDELNVR